VSSYTGEVWQPGLSEERIDTLEASRKCQQYVAENPVKAGATLANRVPRRAMSGIDQKSACGRLRLTLLAFSGSKREIAEAASLQDSTPVFSFC
jgi:hypothetical protein